MATHSGLMANSSPMTALKEVTASGEFPPRSATPPTPASRNLPGKRSKPFVRVPGAHKPVCQLPTQKETQARWESGRSIHSRANAVADDVFVVPALLSRRSAQPVQERCGRDHSHPGPDITAASAVAGRSIRNSAETGCAWTIRVCVGRTCGSARTSSKPPERLWYSTE